jgi:radical SAM superfamily enzyme YgiQ (UPF0313 family)
MKVTILNPPSRFAKNVVRDLFYGCWCTGKRIASAKFPPSTLIYLVAILKREGHDVSLLDSQAMDLDLGRVIEIIKKAGPGAIIIPTSTMSFREDMQTLNDIKKALPVTTVAFGSHVTFMPKFSLAEKPLDYIVMREPEYIIRDLINNLEKGKNVKSIRGLGCRDGKSIRINKPYPFIKNLDDLPFPDRECIKDFSYFNPLVKRLPWTTAITSRGCPGRCNFCTSPSFYGETLRSRSPENVVDEMEEIASMGFKEIFYRDETFTAERKRVEEICRLIKERGTDISWICSARIGTVNKGLMVRMKRVGCHMLRFGVESGVQQILDNINKGIRADLTRQTFKWANSIGMETHAHVMLGCIGESWDTVNQTISFVKDIKPTTVTFGAFTPYPGTEIFERVRRKVPEIGDGSACDLSKVHDVGFYSPLFSDMTSEDVGRAVHKAYREFYLRPSYMLGRLKSMRSLDELRRVVSAGLEVLSYSMSNE